MKRIFGLGVVAALIAAILGGGGGYTSRLARPLKPTELVRIISIGPTTARTTAMETASGVNQNPPRRGDAPAAARHQALERRSARQ